MLASAMTLRILVVAVISACLGWMLFVASFHEDGALPEEDGVAGAMPGRPTVRRRRRGMYSPAPVVKPAGRPSFMEWLGED
jgi:hypothetical protein